MLLELEKVMFDKSKSYVLYLVYLWIDATLFSKIIDWLYTDVNESVSWWTLYAIHFFYKDLIKISVRSSSSWHIFYMEWEIKYIIT